MESATDPVLIPYLPQTTNTISTPKPDIIVVFEKDSVLRQFSSFHNVSNVNVIAITGKGFPDRCSKVFLHTLNRAYPDVPILVFVDSDVYGLEIFWQYALLNSEIGLNIELAGVFILDYSSGWLPLRDREWGLMISLLKRLHGNRRDKTSCKNFKTSRREITRGLLLFKKAEMNVMKTGLGTAGANIAFHLWKKTESVLQVT